MEQGLTIRETPIGQLVPYARNTRTHSADQIAQIAASITEFGFCNPILVDANNIIIAGHGRVLAAQRLGRATVPVVQLGHLTDVQRRALTIADNKIAENSGWDEDQLRTELAALRADDFDLSLLGFDIDDLNALMAEPGAVGLTEAEQTPPVEAIAVAAPGEVWVLGRHRLICGDATDGPTVAHLLAGVTPNLMVTDPPYGVNYDPSWRVRAGVNLATSNKQGAVLNDDVADWRAAWAHFPGDVAYVWHASMFTTAVLASLEAVGFEHRASIVWAKDRFALGRGHYHWQHEPCWYAVRHGKTGSWGGGRDQSTLWNIPAREDGGHGHGTQKPVECMQRPMRNNSSPGQAVYDPFVGSGTSVIAAEQCGRICYAVEISPLYVDVTIRRWQDFTGEHATRLSDGSTHTAVRAAA